MKRFCTACFCETALRCSLLVQFLNLTLSFYAMGLDPRETRYAKTVLSVLLEMFKLTFCAYTLHLVEWRLSTVHLKVS